MKKLIQTVLVTGLLALGSAQAAEKVTIAVPYPPGGAADQLARIIAQGLTADGYTVLVENRPGAGAQIAMNQLKRARKDDITLLLSDHSAFTINQKLYKNLSYDTEKDLKPVTVVAEAPIFLLTRTDGPYAQPDAFLAAARSAPLTYGSPGIGTGTHLTGEMLNQSLDGKLVSVPYRGAAPALVDLMGGQLDFMFDVLAGSRAFVDNDQLAILATSSQERSPLRPDVPTLHELGVDGVDFKIWWALGAQPNLDDAKLEAIRSKVADILNRDDNVALFEKSGILIKTTTPEEMKAIIDQEKQDIAPLIDKLGLSIS